MNERDVLARVPSIQEGDEQRGWEIAPSPSAAFEADNLAMGPTLSHKRDPTHDLKVLRILRRTQAAAERNCSTIKSQVRQSLQEIPCSEPSAEMAGTGAEQKGDRAILLPLMSNTAKEDPMSTPTPSP